MAAEPTMDAALVRLRELLADNDVALLDLVNRRLELVGQIKERKAELDVALEEHSFGGHAIREHGDPLPEETLAACRAADAVLMGAVGLPEFDGAPVRPEQGLIRLRGELDVYANLRPARADGIDLLIVRE